MGSQKIQKPLVIQNLNSDVLCLDYGKIKKLGFNPKQDLDKALLMLSGWIYRQENDYNKTFLITGAASGIGLELSKKIAALGMNLILVDKDSIKLKQISEFLEMPSYCLDLSSNSDLGKLLTTINNTKNIDGIVNCAGIGLIGELSKIDPNRVEELISVNIMALVKLSKIA